MRYLTCDPNTQTIGAAMLSIIDNVQSEEIFPILQEHNLTGIKPDEWYPTEKWLAVMNDLANHANAMPNFTTVHI